MVYLSELAPEERRAAIEATGRPVVTLPAGREFAEMLRHMRHELDAEVLLVEGGPTVYAALYALDAVDEAFLTLGPVVVGGADTLTAVAGERAFTRDEAKRLGHRRQPGDGRGLPPVPGASPMTERPFYVVKWSNYLRPLGGYALRRAPWNPRSR